MISIFAMILITLTSSLVVTHFMNAFDREFLTNTLCVTAVTAYQILEYYCTIFIGLLCGFSNQECMEFYVVQIGN